MQAPRSEGIELGPCRGSEDGNATCGHFEVPLDWADHTNRKARLAVIKYAAKNQPRKGTLFTNPGMLFFHASQRSHLTAVQVVLARLYCRYLLIWTVHQ